MMRLSAASLFAACLAAAPFARADADGPLDRPAVGADRQWAERLGLDAEQARKFSAAERAKDEREDPLRRRLGSDMLKLRSQLAGNAAESEIQESLADLATVRRALRDRDEAFEAAAASILSPSQRAKLLVWSSLDAPRGPAADEDAETE